MGFQRWLLCKQLIIPYYATNLALGLMVVFPLLLLADAFLQNSLMGNALALGINWDFLFELRQHNRHGLRALAGVGIVALVLYGVMLLFLSGGVFSALMTRHQVTFVKFMGDSALFFGRFARLALMSLPLFALLIGAGYSAHFFEWFFWQGDAYEYIAFGFSIAKVGLSYMGFLVFGLIFDYARIDIVKRDEKQARKALGRALRFVIQNFGHAIGISLVLALVGMAGTALCLGVINPFISHHPNMLVLVIIVQQIYIAFRISLRLVRFSSEIALYVPSPFEKLTITHT